MERTGKPCTNLGLSPRDPFSWASTLSASPPYPVSSLPSSPVLCFQPPRSPSPAWAAVPPRPPLPRWQVSLCLTGSRLRRALRLLLTSTQLLPEEEGRAARGGSETVDLVSARNSRETMPWCSRPSLQLFLCAAGPRARRVGPGYFATLSFPAPGVALHSFQLPLPPVLSLSVVTVAVGGTGDVPDRPAQSPSTTVR